MATGSRVGAGSDGVTADEAQVQLAQLPDAPSHVTLELDILIGPLQRVSLIVVKEIDDYFAAWNEPETERQRTLLERSVMEDVELVHPAWGRSRGIDAVLAGIDRYRSALPDTSIVLSSGLDSHNDVIRYAWNIVDRHGHRVMDGVDVVELDSEGRLKRILLFHGQLPEA